MNLNIYQLSKLVSKQKVNALGLFKDNKIDIDTKYLYLYENIVKGKINNDDEAQKALNYTPKSKSFAKFKERYTKKILDYLMLSDTNVQINEFYNEEYFRLLKLYSVAKFIYYHLQRSNALSIFKYIYDQSKKYEFEDLQLFTGLILRKNYAYIVPDIKLYKKFDSELDKIKEALIKTIDLSKFYDKLSHDNLVTKEDNLELYYKEILDKSIFFLNNIKEQDSYIYKSNVYEIAAFAYAINNELEKSINISKSSISLIKQNQYSPDFKLFAAYKDIMSTYLKLKDYKNAKLYLNHAVGLLKKKNFNYFTLKSIEFTILANQKEYDALFTLTQEVIAAKELKNIINNLQEWKLREAFTYILLNSGRISDQLIQKTKIREFRLQKFLNEVDIKAKDKRGTNISILVVELMFQLIKKQYDKVADKLEALNQYTFRYLKNDHTLRSNCFIKMLLKIPEAEYHPLRTIRYVKKYEQKLKENPFELSLKNIDIEIIPYEHLWEIIIDILDLNLGKKNI